MTKSTYLGKCMYCGQQAMLEINDDIVASYEDKPDDWDTYISEEATKICKCEGARAWWNVERRVRKAEKRCEEVAGDKIGEVLKAAVRPIMSSYFDNITIKDGSEKYSVYLDSNERLHVKREHKVVDDKTE